MTTINSRSVYETALNRQNELRREAGTDPAKQRELSDLNGRLEAYRRANPDAAPTSDPSGGFPPDFSGQSVYDPHNQNNVKPAEPAAEPARTPQSPGGLGHPGGVPGTGTPGGGTNT